MNAPRVTPEDIEAAIASEYCFTAGEGVTGQVLEAGHKPPLGVVSANHELRMVTFCVLVLKNGHRIVGVNEGPVCAENFDAAFGRKYAREKAIDQIWPLLGYELRSKLATAPKAPRYTKRADIKRVTCIEVLLKDATSFTAEMVDGLSVTFEVENSKLPPGIGMDLMLPVILEAANKQAAEGGFVPVSAYAGQSVADGIAMGVIR